MSLPRSELLCAFTILTAREIHLPSRVDASRLILQVPELVMLSVNDRKIFTAELGWAQPAPVLPPRAVTTPRGRAGDRRLCVSRARLPRGIPRPAPSFNCTMPL